MSIFKRIFGKDSELAKSKTPEVKRSKIEFAQLNYPPKILLAWVKAMEGNSDLGKFLLDNGYEELFYLTHALQLKQEARDWLMKNGYPHLMAMVNAAEGNQSALHWLEVHGFELLYHVADAVEGEMESFDWLKIHSSELIFGVTKTIKRMKDDIEFNHNDMHSFGRD